MIALVAALEPRKRHAAFLGVFGELARDRPGLQLCLFGTGPEEAALRAQAQALGFGARVRFMGFRTDVERWIAAADLCVLPSMREGLPRVVVQYVAAGKPVVVTHLEGIEEIVEDGVNGFVVGRDDFTDMRRALSRLLDDPALAGAMSLAARSRDLSRWSAERMEPAIDGILQGILRRKTELSAIEQSPAATRRETRDRVGSSVPQRN
jgi:glycosyltransferase involved in cell wall biosynthesis